VIDPCLIGKDILHADAAVFSNEAAGDCLLLEELDEIGAGHIEKGRRLHGRQLGILRDEGDAAARW
jgi:hypothetical protein